MSSCSNSKGGSTNLHFSWTLKQYMQTKKGIQKEVKKKYSKDEFILTFLYPCSFVHTLTKQTNQMEFHFAVEIPHFDIHKTNRIQV
jgi:hypothetical protein